MSFSNADTGSKCADPYKEKNLDTHATIQEKVEGLSNFISACKFGMMTTRHKDSGALLSRCMAVAGKESGGIDLIFHTNTESGKTDDLANDPHINVAFLNSSGEWASIAGEAGTITDRELVKKHYSSQLKAWLGDLGDGKHNGGPDDPRIGVIRVRTKTATYALAKKNVVGRAAEIAQGVITGKAADVNRLREINEGEVLTWRESHKMVS